MNSFNDVMSKIHSMIDAKESEDKDGVVQPVQANPVFDKQGKLVTASVTGTVVSKIGSEVVNLDTAAFQFMECIIPYGQPRRRYCIVEKGNYARKGNQFINSKGERTHVIDRDVYVMLLSTLNGAINQLKNMNRELELMKTKYESSQLLISALKKNGVID